MHTSLQFVLILLAVAVLVVVLCRVLRLPVMLGYLSVGIMIGPHALAWIPDTEQTRYLAEFGVVFLMFSIGLEFSLARLRAMRRTVFAFGGSQVAVTLLGVMVCALLLKMDWRAGLALGGVLAMSSTAIVSKLLVERAELNAPHGLQMMGILLFQDLAVVPLLIVIPALASPPGGLASTLLLALLKASVVLLALLVFGQRLMRPWFHLVSRQKSSELFMLNVLLITLGLAYVTEQAGLSLALGAFVAGILIAETEYRYQVEEDIKPFRDVLLGLFFVTIGMLLDLRATWHNLGWVLLVLVGLLLFKSIAVAALGRWIEGDWSSALRTGFGVAQAGEFGFVLLTQAGEVHLLGGHVMQIVLASMLLSMLVAPFLMQYAEPIVRRISPDEWMDRAMQLHRIAVRTMATNSHVIVCGYGRSGQALAAFLRQEGLSFIALDMDSRRVREASEAGEEVVYGDAAKREVLLAAGLMRAKTLVVTYNDKHSSLKILRLTQELRPDLPVVVRTADEASVEPLKQAGAAEVVAEVLEGSVMLASQALLLSGVPFNRVIRRIQENRAKRYSAFRGYFRTQTDIDDESEDNLQPRFKSVMLGEHDGAVGRAIGELDLAALEVEVNAVRRHNVRGDQPADDMVLKAGDVLILFGQPQGLGLAEIKLRGIE